MGCQNLLSRESKKNISPCRLVKIVPRVLSVKVKWDYRIYTNRENGSV